MNAVVHLSLKKNFDFDNYNCYRLCTIKKKIYI